MYNTIKNRKSPATQKNKPVNRSISIIWHIEDIKAVRPDLNDEQASRVLTKLKQTHDATIGINWEVIDAICDSEFPEL